MIEKLLKIQQELKAPKNQFNKFGNYSYRNCEDIYEAVKPLLKKHNCVLTLNDSLEYIGERYYIKATATITDLDTGTTISNTAYAREEEIKKGMDGSQITGASSSYARKYALNGLFLIDDVKDSDTTNQGEGKKKEKTYREKVILYCKENKLDVNEIAKDYHLTPDTPEQMYKEVLEDLLGGKDAINS